jgi:hypothetical protein
METARLRDRESDRQTDRQTDSERWRNTEYRGQGLGRGWLDRAERARKLTWFRCRPGGERGGECGGE